MVNEIIFDVYISLEAVMTTKVVTKWWSRVVIGGQNRVIAYDIGICVYLIKIRIKKWKKVRKNEEEKINFLKMLLFLHIILTFIYNPFLETLHIHALKNVRPNVS